MLGTGHIDEQQPVFWQTTAQREDQRHWMYAATLAFERTLFSAFLGAFRFDLRDQPRIWPAAHAFLFEQFVEKEPGVGMDAYVGFQHAAQVALVGVHMNDVLR